MFIMKKRIHAWPKNDEAKAIMFQTFVFPVLPVPLTLSSPVFLPLLIPYSLHPTHTIVLLNQAAPFTGKMGGPAARMPTFCLNRMKPRARVRSPTTKITPPSRVVDDENDVGGGLVGVDGDDVKAVGRRIMIVVDSSMEAKGAVNWALTHTIQSQDTVILIHVAKPNSKHQGDEIGPRMPPFLQSMKNMCQLKRPEVQIEATMTKATEKGPTIVEQAKKLSVHLLVLGQKKRSTTWRLLLMWMGNRAGVGSGGGTGGVVEYCIQNATCMAIAVRRKSKKVGGYLITTKRHKDFWLLA